MSWSQSQIEDEEIKHQLKERIKKEVRIFISSKMFPVDPIDICTYGAFKIDRKNLMVDILVEIADELRSLSTGAST